MSNAAARKELEKLLIPIDLAPQFKRFGTLMRRQVRRNLGANRFIRGRRKGKKGVQGSTQGSTVSGFTAKVKGRTSPGGSLIRDMAQLKPRIKKRGVSIGPSRAKKFFKMNLFVKGHSNKITRKQQLFLRALGVREGVFPDHVMFLPPSSPPFAVGRTLFTQARDPFHFGNMDLNKPLDEVATKVLNTWGFK